jgi:hypothetical protein
MAGTAVPTTLFITTQFTTPEFTTKSEAVS